MANLYVAIYKPVGGNVHHWALWLEASTWSRLFEANAGGNPGEYVVSERENVRPNASGRHKSNRFVAQIDDYNGFIKNARSCKAPADSAAWNCQEYVLDVLEAANLDDIIDDYQHAAIKGYLESIHDT
ncbi:uncharacterized protein BDZ99DRAFT_517112 [Mytilinidion resinicola]|uniref:Uncharacterized protein n=1 Tax=Mytilinidion resinicola TaxID=574789 RepID=A0A6A6YXY5_9PEZI|nr:uncharacterized protein BDZ99DRAFT_517112 [Mytilinidion resinicola]KAF2812797.1 hypothetical protein BDZ99DRAFT_517112 [Mytilinidion resinicola]